MAVIKCGFRAWCMRHSSFSIFLFCYITLISPLHAADVFDDAPPDIARIKKRGELIVAMHAEDVPMFCVHNSKNELEGVDIELARDIAEKLGVRLVLNRESKTFDEVAQSVADRKADIALSSLSDTLERAIYVSFTRPYWTLRQALLINRLKLSSYKNHPDFEKIEILLNQSGIKIGVLKGSSYVDFARKMFPLASVEIYDTIDQGVEDTKKARLLAFLYDEVEIMNWNKVHPEDGLFLKLDYIAQSEDTLAIAVNWKDDHLLTWLNLYLEKIKGNFLNNLKKRYEQK